MKLENQCCSLEQSKKLVELGVIKETEFYHVCGRLIRGDEHSATYKWTARLGKLADDVYPAYTVAELGEMLGYAIRECGKHLYTEYSIDRQQLELYKFERGKEEATLIFEYTWENEAQARTEALIWLLENNYITAQQINESA